jgi:hypothetical protein
MSPKRSELSPEKLTMLRQLAGRYASKFTPGGREKKATRPIPSLPKLRSLENCEFKENAGGPKGTKLSHKSP